MKQQEHHHQEKILIDNNGHFVNVVLSGGAAWSWRTRAPTSVSVHRSVELGTIKKSSLCCQLDWIRTQSANQAAGIHWSPHRRSIILSGCAKYINSTQIGCHRPQTRLWAVFALLAFILPILVLIEQERCSFSVAAHDDELRFSICYLLRQANTLPRQLASLVSHRRGDRGQVKVGKFQRTTQTTKKSL